MTNSNEMALIAVRSILGAASAMTLDVDGVEVAITPHPPTIVRWPQGVRGLTETDHGPWPGAVDVDCRWKGGAALLRVDAPNWTEGNANVGLRVRDTGSRREITYINVAKALRAHNDELDAPLVATFALRSRAGDEPERQRERSRRLKALVTTSGLPLLTKTNVNIGNIRLEDATILPSPEAAFERLLRVSLFKLDFISRGKKAKDRGRPLIDLGALGIHAGGGDEDADDVEDALEAGGARAFWVGAGQADSAERRAVGWKMPEPRDSEEKGAAESWNRFDRIQTGDWFAIKAFDGGVLTIHGIFEVRSIDEERGHLDLEPVTGRPLFKGPAPATGGSGSWGDTLKSVARDDVVRVVFGENTDTAPAWEGPRNIVLFGPPGTGKTYRLRDEYRPLFTRSALAGDVHRERIEGLGWFPTIAAALADLGGKASAKEIFAHDFVLTKYASKNIRSPLASQAAYYLNHHTVATSQTVNMAQRSSRQVFDKKADRTWFFAEGGIPEEFAELASSLRIKAADVAEDFLFVTFHQSYAYEDFIEGIRPNATGDDEERTGSLTYELEDGVFLRAVKAATRLAGFGGTLDELCRLPRRDREAVFRNARPYGVFIDELNRGNVSRIFGELITLLEEDKRLGCEGEIIVTLPYSRRRFGVPPNLCVVGTMNTADRSVEALDTALRRRFSFIECAPDPSLLEGTMVAGVDVAKMLRTINARLELLLDRDHRIGHAFFMGVRDDPSINTLKEVFRLNVLPLLAEFFFADLGRIGLVLGKEFVKPDPKKIMLASFPHSAADQLAERVMYRFTPAESLTSAHFKSIYESGVS